MSNELTPQEKYPKFYDCPHLWIGAIEVEVNESFELNGTHYLAKTRYLLTVFDLNELLENNKLDYINPFFKPQEGDQFIKDLESAAIIACTKPNEHENMVFHAATDKHYVFRSTYNPAVRFLIQRDNINWARWRNGNIGLDFNTAAYVDTLRKLGYYL
jgi:hypothetical protein